MRVAPGRYCTDSAKLAHVKAETKLIQLLEPLKVKTSSLLKVLTTGSTAVVMSRFVEVKMSKSTITQVVRHSLTRDVPLWSYDIVGYTYKEESCDSC